MVGYYIASFTATIICTLLGIFVGPLFGVDYRWGFMSIAMLVVLFLIDALLAWLIRKLPEKWFDSNNKHFDERKGERKFYEALGIKKWKDKIPELGGFTDFHKDKIYEPNSIEFYERFILESNYGSLLHIISAFIGYLIIFMAPLKTCFLMAIPMATVNFVLCILPYFVLRYNVGKLKKVLNNLKRRKIRETQNNVNEG